MVVAVSTDGDREQMTISMCCCACESSAMYLVRSCANVLLLCIVCVRVHVWHAPLLSPGAVNAFRFMVPLFMVSQLSKVWCGLRARGRW